MLRGHLSASAPNQASLCTGSEDSPTAPAPPRHHTNTTAAAAAATPPLPFAHNTGMDKTRRIKPKVQLATQSYYRASIGKHMCMLLNPNCSSVPRVRPTRDELLLATFCLVLMSFLFFQIQLFEFWNFCKTKLQQQFVFSFIRCPDHIDSLEVKLLIYELKEYVRKKYGPTGGGDERSRLR